MCENPDEPGAPPDDYWLAERAVGPQVGWHITSRAAWDQIREEGLEPRHCRELDELNMGPIYCSWLWRDPPKPATRLCVAMRIVDRTGETDLVELAVPWTAEDVWGNRYGDRLKLRHRCVGRLAYPVGTMSVVLGRTVGPAGIRVAREWDLLALLDPAKLAAPQTPPDALQFAHTE